MVLSFGAWFVRSLGRGRRRAVVWAIGRRQRGSNGVGTSVGLSVGSIGRGLSWRQRGSIGWSLVRERRLWRINYSRMKKSAIVDGTNCVS